jgi:hypothetical protein
VCAHVYVYHRPKAGILEGLDAAIARQWNSKHVSAVMNQHATRDQLSEMSFSV